MKVTIFGGSGLLGSALNETCANRNIDSLTSKDLDLSANIKNITKIFRHNDVWINSAAKVGGVKANTDFVADFYQDNIAIGSNVMQLAKINKVKKLISILSTCIYPDSPYVSYPLTEDQLHMGPPHQSNFGYAYAKRMLDVASRAYRQQWNCNFIAVIPNNLYGPHDNYDINGGHVIPSLIRKFYEAHLEGHEVVVWGTGSALREFTYSKDAAEIIWMLLDSYDTSEPINIGNTEEISIGDLANLIGKIVGYKRNIKFDHSKPEGQYRKPTSNAKLKSIASNLNYTSLEKGLTETIEHFIKNYPNIRGIK